MTQRSIKTLLFILSEMRADYKNVTEEKIWEKMRELFAEGDSKDKELMSALASHVNDNGGEWLLGLFIHEVATGKLSLVPSDKYAAQCAENSAIFMISSYLEAQPIIITVDGNDKVLPFHVVHADMAVSDKKLREMLQNHTNLTPEQIDYATWARAKDFVKKFRSVLSTVVGVGHNIITLAGNECLRKETSTINADGGAYATDTLVVLDMTHRQAGCITTKLEEEFSSDHDCQLLQEYCRDIEYLAYKWLFTEISQIVKDSVTTMATVSDDELLAEVDRKLTVINAKLADFNAAQGATYPKHNRYMFLYMTALNENIDDDVAQKFIERCTGKLWGQALSELVGMKEIGTIAERIIEFTYNIKNAVDAYNDIRDPRTPLKVVVNTADLAAFVTRMSHGLDDTEKNALEELVKVKTAETELKRKFIAEIKELTSAKSIGNKIISYTDQVNQPIKRFNSLESGHEVDEYTHADWIDLAKAHCKLMDDDENIEKVMSYINSVTRLLEQSASKVSVRKVSMHQPEEKEEKQETEKREKDDPGLGKS